MFYEWQDGEQTMYATGIKTFKATPDKNASVMISFTTKPSCEGHDGDTASLFFNLPKADDSNGKKIALDRQVKSVLYPLADLDPASPAKIRDVCLKIKANLDQVDIKCNVATKITTGKGVDPSTGNPKTFTNVAAFEAVEALPKKAYESNVEYNELDDLDF